MAVFCARTRCGPLQYEPKAKKARAAAAPRVAREKAPVEDAQVVDPELEERTQTDSRVKAVKEELKKSGAASFFDFTFDPSSFTQTIENVFDLSFLIRDGTARMESDPKTHATVVEETFKRPVEQRAERKQCIIKIDFNSY
jgi:hypothetical protein